MSKTTTHLHRLIAQPGIIRSLGAHDDDAETKFRTMSDEV